MLRKLGRNTGLGIAIGVALATPAGLYALEAAPSQPAPARLASGNAFVPVCKAAEVVDTRPDPAWVGVSFAHDNCEAPQLPALIDGYSASYQQIVTGMAATKSYMARADSYQRCVGDFIALERAQAEKSHKPVNANLITIENHRIAVSQTNKKKADALIKVAINAFNELGSECPD
ncbi:MAG TPA: hypothetical protein VG501_11585 [Rhizomicrobium sp.]|nr:hypothetical protein [Rhizomicrobium sp.]